MKLYASFEVDESEKMDRSGVTVIVDVVKSRELADRSSGQRILMLALEQTNLLAPSREPLSPTVGDESQGIYDDISDAMLATLLVRLHLLDDMDCRFGIGHGTYREVSQNARGVQQDGPAWWNARAAIDETKKREHRRNPSLRTWFIAPKCGAMTTAMINSYLLARDHLVTNMDKRSRHILLELLRDPSQTLSDIAGDQRVSPSAVSQRVKNAGIDAIIAGINEMKGLDRP